MKRPPKDSQGNPGVGDWPDQDWVDCYPCLVEHLSDGAYEDKTARELSSLGVKYQDGLILVSLSDHDLSRGLYRTGRTLGEALGALEKALAGQSADWRPWKRPGGKK